jgi:hypothetical protein
MSDETPVANNSNGPSPDGEQLTREDLKYSGKIRFNCIINLIFIF